MFNQYLKTVVGGEYLNIEEAYSSAKMLLHDNVQAVQAAAFLSALRTRKECAQELSGFVQAIYEEAVTIDADMELLDTCGTGGDGLGTFNISTLAAFVVAAAGIPIAKHGNKAMTSKVGSADLLEALGVNIMLSPDEARMLLEKAGITFLFAPHYHPILKEVGPLRREMGVATIFNFLGPLLNPCNLSYQVMGIADGSMQESIALTVNKLGRKRALVINAENGMDEVSPSGKTRVYDIQAGEMAMYDIDPVDLGLDPITLDSILGGDISVNTRIAREVLDGHPGSFRDTVVLNAAAAIMTAGKALDMKEGIQLADELIDSGKAKGILLKMIQYSRDGVAAC